MFYLEKSWRRLRDFFVQNMKIIQEKLDLVCVAPVNRTQADVGKRALASGLSRQELKPKLHYFLS